MPTEMSPQYEAEVTKNRRWNFGVNVADLTFFHFADSFIFSTTIIPLYVSYLTSSSILIGLVTAIQQVGFFLPQIIFARKAESLSLKKPFILKISIWERLPFLLVGSSILLFPAAPTWLAYIILVMSIGGATFAGGLASPAWRAMLGKVIHPDRRGMMFALGHGLGSLIGIGGATISRYLLGRYAYPLSFGLCFLGAFIAQAMSYYCLTLNREPALEPEAHLRNRTLLEYLSALPGILRGNVNFSRFLVSQSVSILGMMGVSFYIVYARARYGISDAFAGTLTMAALLGQAIGIPLLGWFSDRFGHKYLAILAGGLGVLVVFVLNAAPGIAFLFPAFILLNLCRSGFAVSRASIVMEFGTTDMVATYSALSGTAFAVPTFIAPVIGGWVVERFGYTTLFVCVVALLVAGMGLMLFTVRDPRKEKSTP